MLRPKLDCSGLNLIVCRFAFSLIDADAALVIAKESTARWRSGAPLSGIDGVPTTIKDIVWVKDRG